MFMIHEVRGEGDGPFGNDAASVVTRHDREESYFWIENEGRSLIVNHVVFGAEGFFCRFIDRKQSEFLEAIGRGTPHGLALTDDGGGNPWVIDRACVIDRATTIAVVEHFMQSGERSDVVDWGSGIVAGEEHEHGWVVEAVGEPSGPRGWLPGGYRADLGDAPEPELTTTATWRVLSELVISGPDWFATLAEHPMPCLRRLVVDAYEALGGLTAAVAALPALEELIVYGPAVLELPPLRSTTLRRISLGMSSSDDDDDLPPGWSARLAAALARCELPALRSATLAASIDVHLD